MTKANFAGDPDQYGEALYNKFRDKFTNYPDSEVKDMCLISLEMLMRDCDSAMRPYYALSRNYIKERKE